MKLSSNLHGWLLLDKPLGLTSTQALGKARRFLGGKKVGHGGTLDPLASGLLPLAFGEATKLIPYVLGGDKEYEFSIGWGQQRSTDDAEGDVVASSDHRPTDDEIRAALPRFIGQIDQIPPAFSAIKINGERAYDLARAGEEVEMKSRQVMVYGLDFLSSDGADQAHFRLSCGKGTYVRSLARDLALVLGTYGYVTALRRVGAGPFRIKDSISLEKLEELSHKDAAGTALLAIGAALDDIPGLSLTADEAQRLRMGQGLLIRPHQLSLTTNSVILASFQGEPVAMVKAQGGMFTVVRGFHF